MKYKMLLLGKNQAVIEDFFYSMHSDFECQTTSSRYEDISSHIKWFQPDAIVYCIREELRDNLVKMATALRQSRLRNIKLILVGDRDDCEDFLQLASDMVDLTLLKPITAFSVKSQIINLLKQEELLEQKLQEEQERFEKEQEEKKRLAREQKLMDDLVRESKEQEEKIRKMQEEKEKRLQREEQERAAIPAGANGSKHILVIDDDPIMLRLIKEELREDYNVATAVSGKIALKFLERKMTNLILLDYEMPEEDGPAVLEKLRNNEKTKDIPVIFLTGINDRSKIQKVVSMKPQGYLLKPIESQKLRQTIRNIIG